jgi:hypothetical protein
VNKCSGEHFSARRVPSVVGELWLDWDLLHRRSAAEGETPFKRRTVCHGQLQVRRGRRRPILRFVCGRASKRGRGERKQDRKSDIAYPFTVDLHIRATRARC